MNHTTIPDYVRTTLPDIDWEPPKRNILPDEVEAEGLEGDWDYEELNFDGEA